MNVRNVFQVDSLSDAETLGFFWRFFVFWSRIVFFMVTYDEDYRECLLPYGAQPPIFECVVWRFSNFFRRRLFWFWDCEFVCFSDFLGLIRACFGVVRDVLLGPLASVFAFGRVGFDLVLFRMISVIQLVADLVRPLELPKGSFV